MINKAVRKAIEFEAVQTLVISPSPSNPISVAHGTWIPPAQGSVKVNCDVAVNAVSKVGRVAVLKHNDKGKLIDGLVQEVAITSVFWGEALAIRLACVMCATLNLSQMEIEGDNNRVIPLCVSEDAPPWECVAIFADIRTLAQRLMLTFRWCSRRANEVAHWTARARLGGLIL